MVVVGGQSVAGARTNHGLDEGTGGGGGFRQRRQCRAEKVYSAMLCFLPLLLHQLPSSQNQVFSDHQVPLHHQVDQQVSSHHRVASNVHFVYLKGHQPRGLQPNRRCSGTSVGFSHDNILVLTPAPGLKHTSPPTRPAHVSSSGP